jgi:hypothetical protein
MHLLPLGVLLITLSGLTGFIGGLLCGQSWNEIKRKIKDLNNIP